MSGTGRMWWQLARMGVRSLRQHKLRSALTVLGMVFGVASVVSILAIGEGASHELQEQLRRLGPDRILLKSVRPAASLSGGKGRLDYGLKLADLQRIESLVPDLLAVAPSYELVKDVEAGSRFATVPLVCTTPGFLDIHRLEVARGRFLASPDLEARANVAALGAGVARTLFGAVDPVGQEIKLGAGRFRVVGLLKPRADASAAMNDPDASIFLPLTTGRLRLENVIRIEGGGGRRFEVVELHQIGLRSASLDAIDQQAGMLRRLLAREHPLPDYEVMVPYELLRQARRTKQVFSWVLGTIGGISLLVGGIGIMNIMLATVTERTREIGIRRALGARRKHVLLQFLAETIVLSAVGGTLGLGLGLAIPSVVESLTQVKTVVTPESLVLALGISIAVGIVFGLYPARRAAWMDPVEALRHG
ncbi:MAG TPA: ABC transporter permease [Planctomycetota bacterium]|jgi:putative ABC transport system permease protein|nr:ABC transporter permease [Planctomycetota bacterium]